MLKSIAHGRAWLDEIITGTAQGVEAIVARHKCSVRHVNMTTSMALRDHQASRAVAGLEVSMPRSQLRVHRVPDDALGLADFSLSATTPSIRVDLNQRKWVLGENNALCVRLRSSRPKRELLRHRWTTNAG